MARYLTTASNEIEADIVLGRLQEAGVRAWESNSLGGRWGSAGPRDIYVDDAEFDRASGALAALRGEADDADEQLADGSSADAGDEPR